jgi:hypothetical protein
MAVSGPFSILNNRYRVAKGLSRMQKPITADDNDNDNIFKCATVQCMNEPRHDSGTTKVRPYKARQEFSSLLFCRKETFD